uniref:Uncharacterized protein n=1 Tax=Colobus angolensis palliatus TaxID=336983 RepID=A0A2K5HZP7_COLAP
MGVLLTRRTLLNTYPRPGYS